MDHRLLVYPHATPATQEDPPAFFIKEKYSSSLSPSGVLHLFETPREKDKVKKKKRQASFEQDETDREAEFFLNHVFYFPQSEHSSKEIKLSSLALKKEDVFAPLPLEEGVVLATIEASVCALFGISSAQLRAHPRHKNAAPQAKKIALSIAHCVWGISKQEIALFFGCAPVSVERACRCIEEWRVEAAFDRMMILIERCLFVWEESIRLARIKWKKNHSYLSNKRNSSCQQAEKSRQGRD